MQLIQSFLFAFFHVFHLLVNLLLSLVEVGILLFQASEPVLEVLDVGEALRILITLHATFLARFIRHNMLEELGELPVALQFQVSCLEQHSFFGENGLLILQLSLLILDSFLLLS